MIEINKHTDLELAFMAIDGLIGNSDERKKILGKRYDAVQNMVNTIVQTKQIPDSDAYVRLQQIGETMTKYVMEGE